jgi:FRG domain
MIRRERRLPADVVRQIQLRRDAREKFQEFMEWTQGHQPPRWVYRGHSQKWPLRPTIGRAIHYRPETELQIFQEFRRLALPHVREVGRLTTWEWLAIAQHHGLPTRLLDWTINPLIAFYFACGQSARQKKDGEVIAVEARRVGFYKPEDPTEADPFQISEDGFIYPSAVATRISA